MEKSKAALSKVLPAAAIVAITQGAKGAGNCLHRGDTPAAISRVEGKNEKEEVELIFRKTEECSMSLEIRSLRWGEGVGWYVQKTIVLGPTQVRALARVLRQVSAVEAERTGKGKVIPFPGTKRP